MSDPTIPTRFVCICVCGRRWEVPADGRTHNCSCTCLRSWTARVAGDTVIVGDWEAP